MMILGELGIFSNICEMGVTASVITLIVLVIRLLMRRMPKKYICLLWLVVVFRFLCPVVPEGIIAADCLSLKKATGLTVEADLPELTEVYVSGTGYVDEELSIANDVNKAGKSSVFKYALTCIWAVGSCVMAVYMLGRLIVLNRKLRTAVCINRTFKGGVSLWESEAIESPMVRGLFRPRIYTPTDFIHQVSEVQYSHIINHELAHIKRCDIVSKWLSCVTLCVHWFNPFAWLGMVCFQKDMEMACDEGAVLGLKGEQRAEYAKALLQCAIKGSGISPVLLFGESNAERRIKNVLGYRKPTFFGSLVMIFILCFSVPVLATKPKNADKSLALAGRSCMQSVETQEPVEVNVKGSPAIVFDTNPIEDTYIPVTKGTYVEPCWRCMGGNISYTIENISSYWKDSKLCVHGNEGGTDNVYETHYIIMYSCNKCGYGWDEDIYRKHVECQGYRLE